MTKPPKSPLEKPGTSSHHRKPSGPRRTSSSEKSATQASVSSKHGSRPAGHSSKSSSKMTGASSTVDEKPPSPDGAGMVAKNIALAGVKQEMGNDEKMSIEGQESSVDTGERFANVTSTSSKKPGSLKDAVNVKLSLIQQREKLAKHLVDRDRKGSSAAKAENTLYKAERSKVSPVREDSHSSPSIAAAFESPVPDLESTSTESANTVRGGATPGLHAARTPSYPFPPMATPRNLSFAGHRPFTTLSPTGPPSHIIPDSFQSPREIWNMSGSATPASADNLHSTSSKPTGQSKFSSPNLYEWLLRLSAEPGLDAWWTTVSAMMREEYKAERVSLAVPADSTDVENVPWGQKATFSAVDEDVLSLTYLPRGSSLVASSGGGDTNESYGFEGIEALNEDPTFVPEFRSHVRPGLQNRHSFTAYEESRKAPVAREGNRPPISRPVLASRSKSYFPGGPENVPRSDAPRSETLRNAELSLNQLEQHLGRPEMQTRSSQNWNMVTTPDGDERGRVFPVLQALDYEADALIDSRGIRKVLDRGRLIALTRDYPYMNNPETSNYSNPSVTTGPRKSKASGKDPSKSRSNLGSKDASFVAEAIHPLNSSQSDRRPHIRADSDRRASASSESGHGDRDFGAESPQFEEYEQPPPSPWSQSPAPSPAVRAYPEENPFFANVNIGEDSFDLTPVHDYSASEGVETIGVDRSYTVLHIPLDHILLSKPVQSFRLDTAALESKHSMHSRRRSQNAIAPPGIKGKEPAKENRTPVAILSILTPVIPYPSNLRQSLEQISPHLATTFSLCRHYTELENQISGLTRRRPQISGFGAVARPQDEHNYAAGTELDLHQVSGGSMTSPSDYSGLSRSVIGSPAQTPGAELGVRGSTSDKQSVGGSPGAFKGPNDSYFESPVQHVQDKSSSTGSLSTSSTQQLSASTDVGRKVRSEEELIAGYSGRQVSPEESARGQVPGQSSRDTTRLEAKARVLLQPTSPHPRDSSSSRPLTQGALSEHSSKRDVQTQISTPKEKARTRLHSSGVDFSATYPSLPRNPSATSPVDMLPPTDRLKTLMLDTIPNHVFVALPSTGEIVWVNNPFLTYRGQTVAQLYENPWGSIHPEERSSYLTAWRESIRTGQPFSTQVRIRRFDGEYRWFFARAVAGKDTRNVIQHWYGSYMDIHDQHIAEVHAARQEEKFNSEANYRLLANLLPQIIFAASEDKGVIFSNEQWLNYTGQSYDDALDTGFMDYVHPDDLARCAVLAPGRSQTPSQKGASRPAVSSQNSSAAFSSASGRTSESSNATDITVKVDARFSRSSSSSSGSKYEFSQFGIAKLAKSGVIKVSTDVDGRRSYTTEVRLRSKTGDYRWHLVRCVDVGHIKFGNGEGSWFGACTDINDHKLLESTLKEAMESKSKFLSNMSHEIRTPLIGISGMVGFLQQTSLDENQLDYTNTIATSATNLLAIINDILDLSKVDAGMMKLSQAWFHPRALIEDVNELVSTMAISKRLELNYVVDEDVPSAVKGDKIRIRQVLLNVIGNAIKFTSEGEVFSRCSVWKDDSVTDDSIMLEFSIIDTGNGFTKEEAELIFKPFSQIDGSSTRQHGGSGLGLVISRQLVELHGGEMTGSAIPGKGSTFRFTAKFGIPSDGDRPPAVQRSTTESVIHSPEHLIKTVLKSALGSPSSFERITKLTPVDSPLSDRSISSPGVASSGSSAPSIMSIRSHLTGRSSASSVNMSLTHFSEAARASGLDPLSMNLAIPVDKSENATPRPSPSGLPMVYKDASSIMKQFRPPMYSILLICPPVHSREATTKHIEQTLPKDIPHQITSLASVEESQRLISGEDPVRFTHIVLNLSSEADIVMIMHQIFSSASLSQTSLIILTDPQQRQAVTTEAKSYDLNELVKDGRLYFVLKPVKPSRFAFIFDPDRERDLSTDRNRSTAQQAVADTKQNYVDAEKKLGNKGYRILLVEDNLVNRKVLLKFLDKLGVEVEVAFDGMECTEKVFAVPHERFSLILCDLHMPRKDGYQTCREIRAWERKKMYPRMPMIALSANVMAEVQDKCIEAGFNDYVTKPVDFPELIDKMVQFLDP